MGPQASQMSCPEGRLWPLRVLHPTGAAPALERRFYASQHTLLDQMNADAVGRVVVHHQS